MKRVRLIKPLKQEPARPQAPTPINDDPRPDANFTGTLEDWDDRVFLHAVKFRVHRLGRDVNASAEVDNFVQAMRLAIDTLRAGMRVIVYAVTESGRHQALDRKRWEHYAKLYNERYLQTFQQKQADEWEHKIKPRREARKAKTK